MENGVATLWKNYLQLSGKSSCKKHLEGFDKLREVPEYQSPLGGKVDVGRGGRKLQQNITTRFLIEEFRHQGFIENEAGMYNLIFISTFCHLQMTTFLKFMGMTVDELIEF